MDSETYAWEHPSLSMDVVSCLSAISTGIASNPISYPGTFLQVSHGPPVLEEVPTNSLPLDIIEYPAQVNAKPVLIRDSDEGLGTLGPEGVIASIYDEGSPVAPPSESTRRTRSPSLILLNSIFPGSEAWWPASRISNEDVNPADRKWLQECMTTNDPSDQSHQYAPVYKTFSFSAPAALPGTSNAPTVVQNQARNAFRDRPPHFEKRGKDNTGASSRPFRLPARIRGAPKGPYSCNICRKVYAQPQGVTRHLRETHRASICTYCGDFEWGRPYRFKEHLKRRHPDVDPDAALDEATRIYRRPTTIRRYLQQQQGALTLTPEYDQRSRHAESKMRPLTPGPSAAVKVTPVSPSITSFASHDPQPNFAVSRLSTMKGRSELEDDHELQLLDAANSRVPSSQATEEHGATAMDLDISVQSFSTKCGFPRQYALGSLGGRLFR